MARCKHIGETGNFCQDCGKPLNAEGRRMVREEKKLIASKYNDGYRSIERIREMEEMKRRKRR